MPARNTLAAVIMTVAGIVATVSVSAWLVCTGPLDPDRTDAVAAELSSSPAFAPAVSDAVATALTPAVGATGAQALGDTLATNSAVLTVAASMAADSYRYALTGEGSGTVDLNRLADTAVATGVPAETVAPLRTVPLPFSVPHVPVLAEVRDTAASWYPRGIALALVLVVCALAVADDRGRILVRAGRWALGMAAVWLVIGIAVPWLIESVSSGPAAQIVQGALRAATGPIVMVMIPLACAGAGLWFAGHTWSAVRHRRDARHHLPHRRDRAAHPAPRPPGAPPGQAGTKNAR